MNNITNFVTSQLTNLLSTVQVESVSNLFLDNTPNTNAAKSEVAQPPSSNTGVSKPDFALAFSLGWASITFFAGSLALLNDRIIEVKALFSTIFRDDFVEKTKSPVHYSLAWRSIEGAILACNPNATYFSLILNESFCKKYELTQLLLGINELRSFGGRLSRVDWTIDDFSKSLDILQLHNSYFTGELVSRVRRVRLIADSSDREFAKRGLTCYFGDRESDFCSRIYDKSTQSLGEINSIRWEMEVKNELADSIFAYVFSNSFTTPDKRGNFTILNSKSFVDSVLAVLLDRYDFRDLTTSTRVSRCKRSVWFQQFVGYAAKAKILKPIVEKTIVKTIDWFSGQLATTLAILSTAFADDFGGFLSAITKYGRSKLRPRHAKLVSEAIEFNEFGYPDFGFAKLLKTGDFWDVLPIAFVNTGQGDCPIRSIQIDSRASAAIPLSPLF